MSAIGIRSNREMIYRKRSMKATTRRKTLGGIPIVPGCPVEMFHKVGSIPYVSERFVSSMIFMTLETWMFWEVK